MFGRPRQRPSSHRTPERPATGQTNAVEANPGSVLVTRFPPRGPQGPWLVIIPTFTTMSMLPCPTLIRYEEGLSVAQPEGCSLIGSEITIVVSQPAIRPREPGLNASASHASRSPVQTSTSVTRRRPARATDDDDVVVRLLQPNHICRVRTATGSSLPRTSIVCSGSEGSCSRTS